MITTVQKLSMKIMNNMEAEHVLKDSYICPMKHEGSKSDKSGKCPVCGMDLVKMKELEDEHEHEHD